MYNIFKYKFVTVSSVQNNLMASFGQFNTEVAHGRLGATEGFFERSSNVINQGSKVDKTYFHLETCIFSWPMITFGSSQVSKSASLAFLQKLASSPAYRQAPP